MQAETDVLVVGAGPVGLLLAAEMARAGVSAVLIDRMAARQYFVKALGVSPRTLEVLDDLGCAHDAIDAGIWIQGISNFLDGAPGQGMDVPDGALPFGSLSLAQFETERLLEAALHRHGGAVRYGWSLAGFTQDADAVQARLTAPDGTEHRLASRWIVGCDGAHSAVRGNLGLGFTGDRYPQRYVLADIDLDWTMPRGRFYRLARTLPGGGTTALVAVPIRGGGRRYRLSMPLAEGAPETGDAPSLPQLQALMGPLLPPGAGLSNLRWASTYRISHRIVPRYGEGRAFLAGDAAHIHPPVGGQGMNTGLQDAHNLAWKLALAASGQAAPGLLDSYSAERHPVGMDVVENTTHAMAEVLANRPQMPGLRETQLLVGYRGSPIVTNDRPDAAARALAAGDRAPDAAGLRRRFVQHPLRLHDLTGHGRCALLGFAAAGDTAMQDTMAALRTALLDRLPDATAHVIVAGPDLPPERDDLSILADAAGSFATAWDAAPGTAWLVRPDGHIGWCSDAPSIAGLAAALDRIAAPILPNS